MTFSPRFSPDGRHASRSRSSNGGTTNIYALPIGANQPTQLTSGAAIDTSPCYSPDGSRIVFESDRGGNPQLYVMGAGGGGAQRISYGEGSYSTPVWSPKGDLIAYTRQIGRPVPDRHHEARRLATSASSSRASTPKARPGRPTAASSCSSAIPAATAARSSISVDIWGRNEQQIPTETFASDPAWSPLRG